VEGKLTGHCTRTYPDGSSLEGEFREGRLHNGHGVLRRPTGIHDQGQWVEGSMSGPGKRTYPDGRTLEGEFQQGKIHNGQACCFTPIVRWMKAVGWREG
jgi:hypothetical protein